MDTFGKDILRLWLKSSSGGYPVLFTPRSLFPSVSELAVLPFIFASFRWLPCASQVAAALYDHVTGTGTLIAALRFFFWLDILQDQVHHRYSACVCQHHIHAYSYVLTLRSSTASETALDAPSVARDGSAPDCAQPVQACAPHLNAHIFSGEMCLRTRLPEASLG